MISPSSAHGIPTASQRRFAPSHQFPSGPAGELLSGTAAKGHTVVNLCRPAQQGQTNVVEEEDEISEPKADPEKFASRSELSSDTHHCTASNDCLERGKYKELEN